MKNNSINIENFGQYVEKKINDRLFVSNIFKIFEKEQNNSKNSIPYKNIMYCRRMGNTITVVFLCLLAMFCQRISFSVFGIAFACCVPVSHTDVLARFAFQAVCAVLQRGCRFSAGLAFPLGKVTFIRFLVLEQFSGYVKKIELRL